MFASRNDLVDECQHQELISQEYLIVVTLNARLTAAGN